MEREFRLPVNLHREARKHMKSWLKALKARGIIIKEIHFGLYTLIAWSWHDFYKAKDMVEKDGSVLKEITVRGNRVTKAHPALKIMNDAKIQVTRLMVELKLTEKSKDAKDTQEDIFDKNPQLEKFRIIKK